MALGGGAAAWYLNMGRGIRMWYKDVAEGCCSDAEAVQFLQGSASTLTAFASASTASASVSSRK
jgi:hypothetical protein